MTAGSASRPEPTSPPASRPSSGGTTITPRARRVARFCCTAGCSHISVCMAGHTTTGAAVAIRVVVSRSSAKPAAYRASRSAVAGATTTRSARWPSRVWGMGEASSHRLDLGRLGAQGVEGGPAHEPGGPLGQDRGHVDAGVDQPPADLDRLVGGDAGRHPEHDEGRVRPDRHHAPAPGMTPVSATDSRSHGRPACTYESAVSPAAGSTVSSASTRTTGSVPSPSSRASAAASAAATSSGSGRV